MCGHVGGGGGVGTVVVEVVAWKHSDLSVDCENKGGQMSKKVILSPRRTIEQYLCGTGTHIHVN